LNGRISRLRALTLSEKNRDVPGLNHMSSICAAILSKDAKAAELAIKTHIDDASSIAQRLLRVEVGG
jgi:DNA-binding GntR family transcriptional regulator